MKGRLTNIFRSFIPIDVGQFAGFLISFVGQSIFPLFLPSDTGKFGACAIASVFACMGVYILIIILTGGRTFSTINNICACMAITGESTANEAIRNNHVPLPFAFLGFYSGKKKRMKERAGFTHNTMNG